MKGGLLFLSMTILPFKTEVFRGQYDYSKVSKVQSTHQKLASSQSSASYLNYILPLSLLLTQGHKVILT